MLNLQHQICYFSNAQSFILRRGLFTVGVDRKLDPIAQIHAAHANIEFVPHDLNFGSEF